MASTEIYADDDEELWVLFMENVTDWVSEIEENDLNDSRTIQALKDRIQISINCLETLCDIIDSSYNIRQLLEQLRLLIYHIHNISNGVNTRIALFGNFHAPEKYISGQGRPKFVIAEDVLLYFRNLSFSWIKIAQILAVSRWIHESDGTDLLEGKVQCSCPK